MTPLTSPDAWASDLATMARAAQARERGMAAHPAGKAGVQYRYPGLDNQPGAADLLAKITAPPLPDFEDEIYTVMGELASILVDIARRTR